MLDCHIYGIGRRMKALVIGGNGFIGTHLVSALKKEGMDVRVFDRYPSKFAEPSSGVEYVTGDLGNHGALSEIVSGADWVFHLAYTTLPKTSNDDPVYDVRSNLIDTIQLLQECSKSGVRKVVFVSSGGTVYGVPKIVPVRETHPTDPFCSYGITKLAIEKYLHVFYHLSGLDYVVLRVSNPYGEGQNPHGKQGAIGVFLGRLAKGETINIWGDGEVVRDYIYIDDVVSALIAAGKYSAADQEPRVFNIGSGEGFSLNELIAEIRAVVDTEVKVEYEPARALDVPVNVLDITLAKEKLAWHPTVDLCTGLNRTWKWVKTLDPIKQVTLI
jgi:UDP-glucose 4-epimerase